MGEVPVPMRPRSLLGLASLVAALALTLLAAGGPATPAGAGDGDGKIQIAAAHPASGAVHFIVTVTDAGGDAANDATVTAMAVTASGDGLTPVTFDREDDRGTYSGIVDFPGAGDFTVRITSANPTAATEQAVSVSAAASTTTQPAGSGVTTGTDSGFAPADDGTGDSAQTTEGTPSASAADTDGGSGGGMPVWVIALAAVVVFGGAAAAVRTIRSTRGFGGRSGGAGHDGSSGGSDPGTGSGDDADDDTAATPARSADTP